MPYNRGMNNKTLYAYFAGVVDSDGSISIKKSSREARKGECLNWTFSIRISISQVTNDVQSLLKEEFGGSLGHHKNKVSKKRLWRWDIRHKQAETFLRCIYPYLIIKRKQAELLLALRKIKTEPKEGISKKQQKTRWGTMATFNRRCWSLEQIQRMNDLYLCIRELNDTRNDKYFWPIPLPEKIENGNQLETTGVLAHSR